MRVTEKHIKEGRSIQGGWSKEQVTALGVNWPLEKGWKKNMVGKDIAPESFAVFLALKDAHVKSKRPTKVEVALGDLKPRKASLLVNRMLPPTEQGRQWVKFNRQDLLRKTNPSETRVEGLLREAEARFNRERPIVVGARKFFMDFLVTSFPPSRHKVRVAVEVDGGYHFTPEQQAKDRERETLLLATCRVNGILRLHTRVASRITSKELKALILSVNAGEVRIVENWYPSRAPSA